MIYMAQLRKRPSVYVDTVWYQLPFLFIELVATIEQKCTYLEIIYIETAVKSNLSL